jgi:hypothetical protein
MSGIFSGISSTQVSIPYIIVYSWGRDALGVLEEEKEHLPNEHLRVQGTFILYFTQLFNSFMNTLDVEGRCCVSYAIFSFLLLFCTIRFRCSANLL